MTPTPMTAEFRQTIFADNLPEAVVAPQLDANGHYDNVDRLWSVNLVLDDLSNDTDSQTIEPTETNCRALAGNLLPSGWQVGDLIALDHCPEAGGWEPCNGRISFLFQIHDSSGNPVRTGAHMNQRLIHVEYLIWVHS